MPNGEFYDFLSYLFFSVHQSAFRASRAFPEIFLLDVRPNVVQPSFQGIRKRKCYINGWRDQNLEERIAEWVGGWVITDGLVCG